MRRSTPWLLGIVTLMVAAAPASAADELIITDGAGKEHKIKQWKITVGAQPLSFLVEPKKDEPKPADPKKEEKDDAKPAVRAAPSKPVAKAKEGPLALAFRENDSTTYVNGIITYVPIDRIRSIEYDNEKQTVSARVAVSDKSEDDVTLNGSTKFQGINKLTIEATVDLGGMGEAELKFNGGVPKGIKLVKFPAPKAPAAAAAGRAAAITSSEKEKNSHKVVELRPLYQLSDGYERASPIAMFKKTVKMEMAKVQKLSVGMAMDADGTECNVMMKDGQELTLTLLKNTEIDGKPASFLGFLGRSPAGYKLFPAHTIAEVVFE